MKVYVISKNNKPLMPTKPSRARKMLRDKKAKVVQRTPFIIQLLIDTKEYTQPITLGVDAGSKTIGISATTEDEELYSSEIQLRNDISDLLTSRRQLRRTRRNRKTRYRQARFLNRVRTKHKGWLAPSIEHKINSHMKIIKNVCNILPINKIIVETASFDIQKILNPDIQGSEYQQGNQLGFANARDCVLFRDNYKCQNPKCKSKCKELHVHHIIQRKNGGSNRIDNLITLCKDCHNNHHNGNNILSFKKPKQFKDSAFMGVMRKTLLNRLSNIYNNVEETFGYITKQNRIDNNLSKEHRIDAYCISGNLDAKLLDNWYLQKFVRRNNRQLHKMNILKGGVKKNNKAEYEVFGFRLFDKVEFEGKEYFIFGRRKSGFFDIRDLNGNKVNKGSISYKKLRLLNRARSLLVEMC